MTYCRENIQIDSWDLFLFVLKRWKIILLAAVIGLIIGLVYGSYREAVEVEKAKEEADISVLADRLTRKEKTEVDLIYKSFLQCEELNDILEEQSTADYIDSKIELIKTSQQLIMVNSYFSAAQKAYYSALFEQYNADEEVVIDQSGNSPASDIKTTQAFGNKSTLIKNGLIWMIGAILLVVCACWAKYALSTTIRTVEEVHALFGLPLIGVTGADADDALPLIQSNIVAYARNNECRRIYMTSSYDEESTLEKCRKISSLFNGKEILVSAGKSILTDSEAVEEITNSDGIILCEKIGKSHYESIFREIELCNNYGVTIIGAVVIK